MVDDARDLIKSNDVAAAFAKALEAVTVKPDGWEGHYFYGIVFYKQDQLDQASDSLKRALSLTPESK